MAEVQLPPMSTEPGAPFGAQPTAPDLPASSSSMPVRANSVARVRDRLLVEAISPVNQNGSFEFDRVIKSGYVRKRTQKTKTWRSIYLVLRPNSLSIYKSDKEDKLRHKIHLSDLTAVTLLKDPKQKRQNVFGLFSPAKNFHFEAPTAEDANEWLERIREHARIEEEEEEMLLNSPAVNRQSGVFGSFFNRDADANRILPDHDRFTSSSPEPVDLSTQFLPISTSKRRTSQIESSGMSGNELAYSDFSDNDVHPQRVPGASIENLGGRPSQASSSQDRPAPSGRNTSETSGLNMEIDPDRIVWLGWLWFLRTKGGVRQWKKTWAVLRPRNLILYKDKSEYAATFIIPLSSILNAVDIDPISRHKVHCLQVITEEKSYRFAAQDEEELVQCLGAFKSLLAKRRELENKAAAAAAIAGAGATSPAGAPAA